MESWLSEIRKRESEFTEGRSCRTFIFDNANDTTVLGAANLHPIMGGSFQAAYLGYVLGATSQGKGIMFEALTLLIAYAFGELRLHRIMANYMPRNRRSEALLERLHFSIEGYAKRYLLINGEWQDHVLTALTNEHWQGLALHS